MFEPEEYRIAERIKKFVKNKEPLRLFYIMLRDGRILYIGDYNDMVSRGKIELQDSYVYIWVGRAFTTPEFYYPFLWQYCVLLDAYLSKLGFYHGDYVTPATDLRYVTVAERYRDYLSIEVSNLYIAVNNTNLLKIIVEVVGKDLISGKRELTYLSYDEYNKIYNMFISQKLFAGHNFREARDIIDDYYIKDNQSLIKEVARIAMDYDRIFQPYRFCYDMKTWKEVDCLSIKLD